MGRPKKQTVDYFPHYVGGSRRTLFILQESWSNDGYAFWFKLLELLCLSDGHYYDLSTTANKQYLLAYTKVAEETATAILDTLSELGNIDKPLWTEKRIIWCQALVDNLEGVYSKRTTKRPIKPFSAESEQPSEGAPKPPAPEAPAKPPRKPRAKKPEPVKVKYADLVSMTEEEYGKLIARYGEEKTKLMIEKLDNAKGAKGYTYKSDYRAILNWVADRVEEEQQKKGGNSYGSTTINSTNTIGANSAGGFKPSGGFKQR